MSGYQGLRDAHLHLPEFGESMRAVDLSGCTSVSECLSLAAEACARGDALRADWVMCVSARPGAWKEERFPTTSELDEIALGKALVIRSFDHHSASASSEALRRAGLDAAHPEMDASGHVWESAYGMLMGAIPERTDEEEQRCVLDAQRELTGLGYVRVHDMFSTARLARTLVALDERGELSLDVGLFATPEHFDDVRSVESHRAATCGLKLFTDGTLSGRTASMLDVYADPLPGSPAGCPLIDDHTLMGHLKKADAGGYDVACHAIGDRAVRRLLDFDERLTDDLGRTPRGTLRIEHAQFVQAQDIARLPGRAGSARRVIVSPQPAHLLTDIEAVRRHAPDAEARAFPLRSIVEAYADAGLDPALHVELGSDAPVVPPSVEDAIRAACARRREGMSQSGALNPDEAIDDVTALALFSAPAQAL